MIGKTVLYMLDGLYTAENNEGNVFRFASFGDAWASSLLMSQDPVVMDSVGLDILGVRRVLMSRATRTTICTKRRRLVSLLPGTCAIPTRAGYCPASAYMSTGIALPKGSIRAISAGKKALS
jgi:hypothetical protein